MKAAIYARMSTDKQSADSPADQIARCREYAKRHGWQVVEDLVVTDERISGAAIVDRPALRACLDAIHNYDVLLCWEFSRLARDEGHLADIRGELEIHRKTAIEVKTGLDIFNIASRFMGVIDAQHLDKIKHDTHRGLQGRFERGLATGCVAHGYRTEPVHSGHVDRRGNPVPDGYRIVTHEHEAVVIRRIFEEYIGGLGLTELARKLNRERIAPPKARGHRGGSWSPTALRGILINPIYKGVRVWNTRGSVKDRRTGKRRRFKRPKSEWLTEIRPELEIVTPEMWKRAQRVREARSHRVRRDTDGRLAGNRRGYGRKPRQLLSGFLECASCGNGFHTLYRWYYGCGWHYKRGPEACPNAIRPRREDLENRVISAIQSQILVPEHVRYAVEQAMHLVRQELGGEGEQRANHERRLEEIGEEIERLVELAAELGNVKAVARQIEDREHERDEIKAALATAPRPIDFDAVAGKIEAHIIDLRDLLSQSPEDAREALRQLFGDERIRVSPHPERGFAVDGVAVLDLMQVIGGAGDRIRTCTPFGNSS